MRPIMVLFVFPLFGRHFGSWWVLPKLTVCPVRHPLWPSTLQKHVLKGNCPIDAKNTTKRGKNKRTNGSIFTHAHPNILIFSSVFVLGKPHSQKKSPSLPCASLEPELRNRLIRICGPRTPQNTQQMRVCNWCGRGFCVIPPQLILQTFFCVIDYAECHYTFLKIDSQIIFLCV